jgi:hypothetical protein
MVADWGHYTTMRRNTKAGKSRVNPALLAMDKMSGRIQNSLCLREAVQVATLDQSWPMVNRVCRLLAYRV